MFYSMFTIMENSTQICNVVKLINRNGLEAAEQIKIYVSFQLLVTCRTMSMFYRALSADACVRTDFALC